MLLHAKSFHTYFDPSFLLNNKPRWRERNEGKRLTDCTHRSGSSFSFDFFFFHSLPLLVCEDGQLVFVPDTCVSLFFNCGHRERRGRERERNKQFWMNVVAIVLLCLIFLVKQVQAKFINIISCLCVKATISNSYGDCRFNPLGSWISLSDYYFTQPVSTLILQNQNTGKIWFNKLRYLLTLLKVFKM